MTELGFECTWGRSVSAVALNKALPQVPRASYFKVAKSVDPHCCDQSVEPSGRYLCAGSVPQLG